MNNDVVIYQSSDGLVKMEAIVDASNETIWATQKAMAELFGVNVSGISRHLVNVFSSGELDEKSNLQKMQIANSDRPVAFYSLDVIISVGYRVNSIRATAFRKWATSVLNWNYGCMTTPSNRIVPEVSSPMTNTNGWSA